MPLKMAMRRHLVRLAAAAIPYLDEGELRRLAEGESPRARRAVRLIERSEMPFAQFSQFLKIALQ